MLCFELCEKLCVLINGKFLFVFTLLCLLPLHVDATMTFYNWSDGSMIEYDLI